MASSMFSWDEMSASTRLSLFAGVALIVAIMVGAFFWLAKEDYQVLFTDLEPRDAAGVVSELERLKIDYKLVDAGGAGQSSAQIQVPTEVVHEVRLKLMGSGVPLAGGVGFEIFDNSDFGMTEFAQRINYQRALEGELTRTITSLKEVKYARVHLVMSEQGLFQEQDKPASASVTLFLNSNNWLSGAGKTSGISEQQILGIQRLVASSVSNLEPGQVMVSDQNGITLSRKIPEQQGVVAVEGRLKQKQAVEDYLSEKVNQLLATSFGVGQAVVSVDATLDFKQVKRTLENVITADNGEGSVIRRRETSTQGKNREAEGNITTEVEYRLGRQVEQIVETPGKIQRLSVGVIVPPDTNEARRQEIRELIVMAVGLDLSRGDAIAVHTMGRSGAVGSSSSALKPFSDGPFSDGLFIEELYTKELSEFNEKAVTAPYTRSAMASSAEELVNREGGSTTVRADNSEISQLSPFSAWAQQHRFEIVLLFGVLVFIAVLVIALGASRRKGSGESIMPLSAMEREQALLKLENWLNEADMSQSLVIGEGTGEGLAQGTDRGLAISKEVS